MPETCGAAGCQQVATLRIVNAQGYEVAVTCDADAWRFETRTFPVGDMSALDRAEPPMTFAAWWEHLPNGWPVTEPFRRCARKAWQDTKAGKIGSTEGSGTWPGPT